MNKIKLILACIPPVVILACMGVLAYEIGQAHEREQAALANVVELRKTIVLKNLRIESLQSNLDVCETRLSLAKGGTP